MRWIVILRRTYANLSISIFNWYLVLAKGLALVGPHLWYCGNV